MVLNLRLCMCFFLKKTTYLTKHQHLKYLTFLPKKLSLGHHLDYVCDAQLGKFHVAD